MAKIISKRPVAAPEGVYTKIIVSRLAVDMFVGVHDFEKKTRQRVLITVEASLEDPVFPRRDDIADTLNYENIINSIRQMTRDGHIQLIETVAERIAAFCLADRMVAQVLVRVEKPDIIEDAACVAVEIMRAR